MGLFFDHLAVFARASVVSENALDYSKAPIETASPCLQRS